MSQTTNSQAKQALRDAATGATISFALSGREITVLPPKKATKKAKR